MARSRRTPAMLVGRCSSQLSGHSLQGKLKSHSLRAKPRDLQFCRPVVEMFFEEAVWALRPVGLAAKPSAQPGGAGSPIPQHCPSAVGAAHFLLNLYQYCVKKHFQDEPVELQIPRLRSL